MKENPMSAFCSTTIDHNSYFVVMIDFGRKGREAIVDPELTYQNVVGRVASHEYDPENILFIHHIDENGVEDVTNAILEDAGVKARAA
jgi:hypothetical protein